MRSDQKKLPSSRARSSGNPSPAPRRALPTDETPPTAITRDTLWVNYYSENTLSIVYKSAQPRTSALVYTGCHKPALTKQVPQNNNMIYNCAK